MPIVIVCPNCQCKMSVPDSLAGKHGKCSKCKGPVTVPGGNGAAAGPAKSKDNSPAAPPPAGKAARGPALVSSSPKPPADSPAPPAAPAKSPEDLEAEAMSVLGDETAETAAKAASAIEFECPMCFEPVKLGLDLGGKKHPCPHCKRIITVPIPKIEERASWRDTGPKLPSAARRDEAPALEGAWGSTTKTGPSQDALREAGVIKEKEKPKTFVQKIAPYVVVGVPLLLLAGGGWGAWIWLASGKEKEALEFATQFAGSADKSQAASTAALHAGAAVYQLHVGKTGTAAMARDEILKAVGLASTTGNSPEADAVLLDLATLPLELGGTKEEVDTEMRLKPDKVQETLRSVLGAIKNPDVRLEALRRVSAGLVERGQTERVLPLAQQLYSSPGPEQLDALATVGLELLALGKKEEAIKAADRVEGVYRQKKEKDRPALNSAVVALAVSLGHKPPEPKKNSPDEGAFQVGKALAGAREGKLAEARSAIQKTGLDAADQFRDNFIAALVAVENKQADRSAYEALLPQSSTAAQKHPWTVLLLIDVALRAGVPAEGVEPAVTVLKKEFNSWAQLLVLRTRLAASRSVESADVLEKFPANSLGGRVARLDLSRHNMRRDSGWFSTVKGWENVDRAFGSLGVAQGMQKK
jgi:hypothetical protein